MDRHPHGKNQVLKPEDLTESFEPIVGQSVTLRTLRREDIDIEGSFLRGLSPETRHNRLLGGMIQITPEYLERLTTIDFKRDMAIAAALMLDGREVLIGVARYVLDADGRACEFALVISDAWQGRGIGRRMMEKLISVARNRALQQMHGEVLSTNSYMLSLCRKLGFAFGRNPDDPTVTRIVLKLS
ncbi:MAG: GNAT family N-acetyltransferase [Candidatus Parcubacteria bacterium]|nr:GNAT family N-acetyltransferase [Burkholderiales bacterium]